MNRRSMFRAVAGLPVVSLAPADEKPEVGLPECFAFAPVTTCVLCDSAVTYLMRRGLLPPGMHLVQCGAPNCQNRWPWIQEGTKQTRATATIKRLVDRIDQLYLANWQHKNAIEDKFPYGHYHDNRVRAAALEGEHIAFERELGRVYELIAKELA